MKADQEVDYSIFDKLINKNIPFALYRQSNDKTINFILQDNNNLNYIKNIADVGSHTGFVISPFIPTPSTPVILIRPDIHTKGIENINEFINNLLPDLQNVERRTNEQNEVLDENSFEFYKHNFETFHSALEREEFEKLVLSRSVEYSRDEAFSIGKTFERAAEKYLNAFVYLCHTPDSGTWLGSSPELLLSGQDFEWHTVALAGTKNVDENDSTWDDKNRDEQHIVVKYIEQQLEALNIDFSQSEPYSSKAGTVIHLKTDFTFQLNSQDDIGDLLCALHPTPAVCGYPKEEALHFITENESYDRRYYAGFIGPINIDNSTSLHVNLRCMEVLENTLRLYAGGGLLVTSDIINEWLETEYKLQTILSIINTENN